VRRDESSAAALFATLENVLKRLPENDMAIIRGMPAPMMETFASDLARSHVLV
jgi:hypothetical protein